MELLTAVMARAAEIIEGIDDRQWGLPTPCEGHGWDLAVATDAQAAAVLPGPRPR